MPKAIIIGAGPAGTATALAVHAAGWEAEVCEAYAASAGLAQGAFLTTAVNGLAALARFGAADAVAAIGFRTGRMHFTSGTGKALGTMPLGPDRADGSGARTVRRADLYAALREQALASGIDVVHDRRLVDARTRGDRVTAVFADGTTAEADLLVGADGLRSTVRRLIDPAAPEPRPTGLGNVGALTRAHPLADAPRDGDYHMIWGRRCFFGYTIDPSGELWWFANPPTATAGSARGPADPETLRAELVALLSADRSPAAAIVAATDGPILFGEQLELPRVPVWQRDRMVLVGDAAHAVSPSTGQGVSLAWEDAAVLAACLAEAGADPAGTRAALAAYEQARRPRVERVAAWGRRTGNAKAAGPVGSRIRDALFPLFARLGSSPRALRRQAWLFEPELPQVGVTSEGAAAALRG